MAIYSDLNGLNPTKNPLLKDVDAVYQSLSNIFNTRPGERVFLVEFGIDLEDMLFEIIDEATSLELYRRVVEAVGRWEKRVSIDNSRTQVIPDPENNQYILELYFQIEGMGDQTFEFRGAFTK